MDPVWAPALHAHVYVCLCLRVCVCVGVCMKECVCVYAHVHKHHDLARGAGRVGIRIGKGFPGKERSKAG